MSNPTLEQPVLSTNIEGHAALPWRRWLLAFDAYNASSNIMFTTAIWVIYLAVHGYSPLAIGLFEMVFHLAKFLAEVPTGIFADLLGRRKSLIVYCVISTIEILLFLVPTVPLITLSFALAGLSYAFRGGANEAILWSLAGYAEPARQSKRYSRLVSRMFIVGMIGEIIGTASGGYLGHILEILPFICRAAVTAIAIIPLLMLPEQRTEIAYRVHPLLHLGRGLRVVWQRPSLFGLILISGLTESCWQTIYYYYQLYMHGLGFSLEFIGLVVTASILSNLLFTALAPYIMHHLPERWLIPTFVGIEIIGLLLMSMQQPVLGLVGYLVFLQASIAVLAPAISTYINEQSTEAQRATILSFQTGMFSAVMIVLFPLFGLGVSHIPYTTVYLWTFEALITGSVGVYVLTKSLQWMRK